MELLCDLYYPVSRQELKFLRHIKYCITSSNVAVLGKQQQTKIKLTADPTIFSAVQKSIDARTNQCRGAAQNLICISNTSCSEWELIE